MSSYSLLHCVLSFYSKLRTFPGSTGHSQHEFSACINKRFDGQNIKKSSFSLLQTLNVKALKQQQWSPFI